MIPMEVPSLISLSTAFPTSPGMSPACVDCLPPTGQSESGQQVGFPSPLHRGRLPGRGFVQNWRGCGWGEAAKYSPSLFIVSVPAMDIDIYLCRKYLCCFSRDPLDIMWMLPLLLLTSLLLAF